MYFITRMKPQWIWNAEETRAFNFSTVPPCFLAEFATCLDVIFTFLYTELEFQDKKIITEFAVKALIIFFSILRNIVSTMKPRDSDHILRV